MGSSLAHSGRRPDGGSADTGGRDPLSIPAEVKASIRILIIDDERTLRESCASVLQMDGYNVTLIGRGEEALETVKRRKFDIILVDLYMSQTSGMDILRSALEFHRDTIVVVMTGNPSVTSSIEALRAGAWDYLPKPFAFVELLARSRALLRRPILSSGPALTCGDLLLDTRTRCAQRAGR